MARPSRRNRTRPLSIPPVASGSRADAPSGSRRSEGPSATTFRSPASRAPAGAGAARRRPAEQVDAGRWVLSYRVTLAIVGAGALLVAVPALFYRLADLPIVLWDESRVATDAIEMAKAGLTLAPTYGGVVDHYLLKPPLAVWLEALSIALLGPTEMAVRLPSAIAALGTAAILVGLLGVYLRRPVAAFVAVVTLFSSAGYLDFHAARSGDVDSLYTFFTTAWLVAAFLYLEDRTERRRLWLVCWALALVLDLMAKSAAALLPLPALLVYVVLRRRTREVSGSRAVWVASAAIVVLVAAYFVSRELVDPGYTALAVGRDLFDRSASTLEGHTGPLTFYLEHSIAGTIGFLRPTGAFPLLVPSIVTTGLIAAAGPRAYRPLAAYLALSLTVMLVILSLMETKIVWYALPLYPLAATGIGLTAAVGVDLLDRFLPGGRPVIGGAFYALGVLVILLVVRTNAGSVDERIGAYRADERYATGLFLAGPVARSGQTGYVVAADPGFGPAMFYARAAAAGDQPAPLVSPVDPLPKGTAKVVACGSAADAIRARGYALSPLLADGACALYAITTGPTS